VANLNVAEEKMAEAVAKSKYPFMFSVSNLLFKVTYAL
jgi:hypothetical protein